MKKFIQTTYRIFQARFVKKWILPRFFSQNRQCDLSSIEIKSGTSNQKRIWFHAASVGELESLWSLIELFANDHFELILTVLSESARGSLEKLKQNLQVRNAVILYCGFSPWEGEWGDALRRLSPTLFVTAKYEAWPDLWITLKELNIPLAIVGARARKSLKIANRICKFFVGGPPSLSLFPCLESEAGNLKLLFPSANIQVTGEPRWDRVFARSQAGNPRAKELIQLYGSLHRPWGVIGSAWIEDLRFIQPIFETLQGTFWVVPHKVDSESIQRIEFFLNSEGFQVYRSSRVGTDIPTGSMGFQKKVCILVDEMGFLSEIYSAADWAYVGGGWGAGVHSTIEPGIHGIPIGVGPRGTEKFSEIQELSESGQLSILTTSTEALKWFHSLDRKSEKKETWKGDAQRRLGAAHRIYSQLRRELY